jgi:hypothetical protein
VVPRFALAKNGRGRYVILDIADYQKMEAHIKRITEISKGCKTGEEPGEDTPELARPEDGNP